jgi:hypothetical protein
MGIVIVPFVLIMLLILVWVSYYTSKSLYRSLVKNDNKNARLFQVLTFIGMFVALSALLLFFIANNISFER